MPVTVEDVLAPVKDWISSPFFFCHLHLYQIMLWAVRIKINAKTVIIIILSICQIISLTAPVDTRVGTKQNGKICISGPWQGTEETIKNLAHKWDYWNLTKNMWSKMIETENLRKHWSVQKCWWKCLIFEEAHWHPHFSDHL